MHRYQYHYLI